MTTNTIEYSESAAPATIRLSMGRKQFNTFLHQLHGNPDADDWKAAQIELTDNEVASSKFGKIEFFIDSLVGPIVAQHEDATEKVHVTIQRPTNGIYRTAEDIVSAIQNEDITPKGGAE